MLINCAAYQDGKKLRDTAVDRVREYLGLPNCFVWVALHDPSAAELDDMQNAFGLHSLAVEDARLGHQRPKVEEYGDSLFSVLHMVEPHAAGFHVGELAIFAGHNYVLSVRNGARKGFQDVRLRCEREPDLLRQGPGFIVYALMDAVVDRYFPILDALEDDLDGIERRIFAPNGAPRESIEALYALKQRLMIMKHSVAPLLEGVSNLSGARVPILCAGLTVYFRDVYDHLQRLNQTADSIRDTVATAISVNLSMVTLLENENMKRLAAYAALLAVPTMIAGIYGMNFQHMPELTWRYGYELSLLVMAGLDIYLYFRFKRSKWL
ncbi:MAG: magnesium/cobalt transporter CorA [Pseudomonadota bacterium]|nr:magnesium/cobalt transporter CorA [Pseudomonadota bacterium]